VNEMTAGIPMERLAAITAALAVVLDQPVGSFVVKSVEMVPAARLPAGGVWAKVGLMESHFARRQFGTRGRR
jgi:hypothetical protein